MKNKSIISLITAIFLTGCNTSLKRADEILALSYAGDNAGSKQIETVENGLADGASESEILAYILSTKSIHYFDVVQHFDAKSSPSLASQVMNGLVIKSDRICKAYLDRIIDTRNAVKITNQALSALPPVIAAISSSGTSGVLTAVNIANVQSSATAALKDLGIGSDEVKTNITEVQEIRSKMRSAITQQLAKREFNKYDIYAYLIDLESYHGACSLFDQIFYNFKVAGKLAELNAYQLLEDDSQMELLK